MNRNDLIALATSEAQRQGVDPSQILPLIGTESAWDPNAVSAKGAGGLMQLMPDTAASLGLSNQDRFDPAKAIPAGISYYKQQLDAFGSPALAYAAYNAGPGAVRKYGGVPPYPETQHYVDTNMAKLGFDGSSIFGEVTPAAAPTSDAGSFDGSSIFKDVPKPQDLTHLATAGDVLPLNQDNIMQPTPEEQAAQQDQATRAKFMGFLRDQFDSPANTGALAGEAAGAAKVGLGAMHYAGKGLSLLGATDTGNALTSTADAGRQKVDSLLEPYRAASPFATGAGELGGEIVSTLPVGGALGKVADLAAPLVGRAAPYVEQFANALRSNGLNLGGAPATTAAGRLGALGLRTAAGALTGGTQAALANPDEAGRGFVISALTPGATMAGRLALDGIGAARAARLAGAASPKLDTLNAATQAGYVVPPSSVNPSFANTTLESIAGKISTAQTASVRNQEVTDALARKALGLPENAPLTPESLKMARADAYQHGYEPLQNLGMVPADSTFNQALDNIASQYTGKGTIPAIEDARIQQLVNAHKSNGFDASDAVNAIRIMRENADDAFKQGETALARAYRGVAQAYEQQLERAAQSVDPNMLDAYRAARANIAKNFSVQKGLRSDGNVDAAKLVPDLRKGKLSDELKLIAQFADTFPKAVQPAATVAGPGVHNLRAWGSGLLGTAGWMGAGPMGAALGALPFVAPPLVRGALLSRPVQGLLGRQPSMSLLGDVLDGDSITGLLGRTAPLLGVQ